MIVAIKVIDRSIYRYFEKTVRLETAIWKFLNLSTFKRTYIPIPKGFYPTYLTSHLLQGLWYLSNKGKFCFRPCNVLTSWSSWLHTGWRRPCRWPSHPSFQLFSCQCLVNLLTSSSLSFLIVWPRTLKHPGLSTIKLVCLWNASLSFQHHNRHFQWQKYLIVAAWKRLFVAKYR